MSDLEIKLKPLLASLSGDLSVQLDEQQQLELSYWAVKTAIVIEATKPRTAEKFFTSQMRRDFRKNFSLPQGTRIWIGRYKGSGLFAAASQIEYKFDPLESPGYANVTTMVVGHLVIQLLCLDFPVGPTSRTYNIPNRAGDWDKTLFSILPRTSMLLWPPARSFGSNADDHPLTELRDRWRVEAVA